MDKFQVDELKLYLGNGIKIADGIVLKCPTIGDIADYGEAQYFSMAQTLCATPSSMKVALDDMKLDYMKVKDFELFAIICQSLPQKTTELLLGDLDLSSFKLYSMGEDEVVLSNKDNLKAGENPIIINQVIYDILVTYIRKMHGFKKQVDKAGNAITKKDQTLVYKYTRVWSCLLIQSQSITYYELFLYFQKQILHNVA